MTPLLPDFPLELLIYILEYACDGEYYACDSLSRIFPRIQWNSGIAFASANRSLSRSLLRKTRRIYLSTDSEKWKSDELRSQHLGLIDYPHQQLSIISDCCPSTVISNTPTQKFRDIYRLTVTTKDSFSLKDSFLMNMVKENGLKLKDLRIVSLKNIEGFDAIPSLETLFLGRGDKLNLEKLNIPAFTSLRRLTLFGCDSVCDLSCLDGIHHLELLYCRSIRDISCLNHNYRILIACCFGILTYAESFRYSTCVTLLGKGSKHFVYLGDCCSLTDLFINVEFFVIPFNLMTSSLHFLSLKGIVNLKVLPPNRLQKVSIVKCPNFKSLSNMSHIRSIHLEDLDSITTLTGLGSKNQIVELIEMRNVEDIIALKESTLVKILFCSRVDSYLRISLSSSLPQVRELHVHESLIEHYSKDSVNALLKKLQSLAHLKVFQLTFYANTTLFMACYKAKPFILGLYQVAKFILSDDYWAQGRWSQERNIFQEEEILRQAFIITRMEHHYGVDIVLLRKAR